ncbi:hypothetical protein ED733_006393 [Metarhizium rileyi]|uniref:LysM domain-containing protein n=1 Tax=Metarhizium rileyi (strain RCEF 4871) TaxID=1649241 RepID=A0A5C6GH10_METRR|nr:hypothetical protein ED733_006393 [Metarhizium rileyi]
MTDRGNSATRQTYLTSSSLSQSCQQAASSVRPRNRRVEADDETQRPSTTAGITKSSGTSYSSQSATQKDNPGPPKVRRSQGNSISDNGRIGDDLAQFLGESWTQSWTSVQTFASKLISGGNSSFRRPEKPQLSTYSTRSSRSEAWGPLPPSRGPTSDDIGAESLVKKRDALKAAKMASILESHKSANGGLDITGKHKRRTSDEIGPLSQETEEHLVYVHHVEPNDTYAGIILRYKCREDIFRKSNGLWSRDSVQMQTAHFGFGQGASGIVESPIEGCRDSFVSRQGTGLDRAAAAVEHWLRGALAKRPSTPLLGGLLRPTGISVDSDVDLIELTDTASDDGKATREVSASTIGSLQSMTTGRIDGGSSLKGRAKFDPGGRGAHQKDD